MEYLIACFIGFGVGFIIGKLRYSLIGVLRYVEDDEDLYFFMELDTPDAAKILKRKYILLKVDPEAKRSLK